MSDSRKANAVPAAMCLPGDATPLRPDGSIRRTSHIDMQVGNAPHGEHAVGATALRLTGAARDLVTIGGVATTIGAASLTATADELGRLTDLSADSTSPPPSLGALVGTSVRAGFRAAVAAALPDEVAVSTPLALLLDDLPVAALISGYALLYEGRVPNDAAQQSMKSDICSGWRAEGTMMTSVRAGRGVPVTIGPGAPPIELDADVDPDGWHAIGPLTPGTMRRRRLVDVTVTCDAWDVVAMFRDTHADGDGRETVLHEYHVTASVDPATRAFITCRAVPRVLPWVECPVAAASADRLCGQPVDDVRAIVRNHFHGISTCTHLNDLLRSLGDVGALAAVLEPAIGGRARG